MPSVIKVNIFCCGPSIQHLFGRRYTDCDGQCWELTGCNDLNVPYWSKVCGRFTNISVGTKAGKTQYTLTDGKRIVAEWLRDGHVANDFLR